MHVQYHLIKGFPTSLEYIIVSGDSFDRKDMLDAPELFVNP